MESILEFSRKYLTENCHVSDYDLDNTKLGTYIDRLDYIAYTNAIGRHFLIDFDDYWYKWQDMYLCDVVEEIEDIMY